MAFEKTEGVILKKNNFSDYHKMVTIFTKDFGKKTVAAKGVRKLKSKLAPHLEVGMKTKITITRGKKNDILTGAQVINAHKKIHQNLTKTSYLYTLAELVDKLTEDEHEDAQLYDIVSEGVLLINELDEEKLPAALCVIIAHLLNNSGIYPETDVCSRSGEKLIEEDAAFSHKKQGVIKKQYALRDDPWMSVNQIKYLKYLKKAHIKNGLIAGLSFDDTTHVKNILMQYTAYSLSQVLKSSNLSQKIEKIQKAT